jgi:hypothetical protein
VPKEEGIEFLLGDPGYGVPINDKDAMAEVHLGILNPRACILEANRTPVLLTFVRSSVGELGGRFTQLKFQFRAGRIEFGEFRRQLLIVSSSI